MTQISAADMKLHLSIPAADSGNDGLIEGYIGAAESFVARHLRRDMEVDFPGGWPPDALQAVRLLVADWYENREPVTSGGQVELPMGVRMLLAPLRDLGA
ncbi:head-tail connector protein [Leisingera daeponensis]|uniref:Head-tail connector protein n=1 Tax=Leisingera daeponensis TaxID=405746 RepID=A0ABS7NEL5_9RHOB|nr:head-tail connector protein [Leisingera daeponensis]MBY6138531.1 head-tail connector protein [Leisingera daeponensis]